MQKRIKEDVLEKTYYSYVRVSSDEQAKKGKNGLQRQIDSIDAYCVSQKIDPDTVIHFKDEGKSAYHGDHLKKGAEFFDFVQKLYSKELGANPVLLVESLDRLSRQEIFDAQLQLMTYMSHGLEIVTLIDNQIYTRATDTTKLTVSIIIALTKGVAAHEESDKRSKRQKDNVKKALKKAKETKAPVIGSYPAWIRAVKDKDGKTAKLELIPDRAKLVKEICKLVYGGMSKSDVAKLLNERGEPTFGRGKKVGKKWYVSYIQQICVNPALIGEYHPYRTRKTYKDSQDVIKKYFPSVTSNKIFAKISTAGVKYAKSSDNKNKILTIGLVIFYKKTRLRFRGKGIDKRNKNPKFKAYYTAHSKTNKLLYSVDHALVEHEVFDILKGYNQVEEIEKTKIFKKSSAELQAQAALVYKIQSKLDSIAEFVAEGEYTNSTTLKKKIENLEDELKDEKATLEQIKKTQKRKNYSKITVRKTLEKIKNKTYSRKLLKEIASAIITSIVIQDDGMLIYLSDGTTINTIKHV